MLYKLIIFLFLVSCTNYSAGLDRKKSRYSASGFAYIEKNIPFNLEKIITGKYPKKLHEFNKNNISSICIYIS